MADDARSKAFPPLYLLHAGEECPGCRLPTIAYALLADALYDPSEGGTFPGPVVLKDIEQLPKHTLALLQPCCPGWEFDRERPGRPPYLMNHCHRCRAKLTDRYLHAEPGSAFYPGSPDECRNIDIFVVPASDPLPAVCSFTSGGLTEWLNYRTARPLMQR